MPEQEPELFPEPAETVADDETISIEPEASEEVAVEPEPSPVESEPEVEAESVAEGSVAPWDSVERSVSFDTQTKKGIKGLYRVVCSDGTFADAIGTAIDESEAVQLTLLTHDSPDAAGKTFVATKIELDG